jgi:hypothetical protein
MVSLRLYRKNSFANVVLPAPLGPANMKHFLAKIYLPHTSPNVFLTCRCGAVAEHRSGAENCSMPSLRHLSGHNIFTAGKYVL